MEFEALESRQLLSLSEWVWFEQLLDKEALQRQVVSGPVPINFLANIAQFSTTTATGSSIVNHQWIVQLKQELLQSIRTVQEASEHLVPLGITVGGGLGVEGLLLVQIIGYSFAEQNELLGSIDCFDYWEPNGLVHLESVKDVVNDPYAKDQWGLDKIGVETAWKTSTGTGVVVAVLDTGIDLTHPDLQSCLWINPGEMPGNLRDDDNNGFVDDVYGWNFVNKNNNVMDDHYHGTHVSGVIAATMNNKEGGVGVAPNANIMTCKVLAPTTGGGATGLDSDIIAAINYVTLMKTHHGINVSVINASFGGPDSSASYQTAITNAGNAGIVFVAAAGNHSSNNDNVAFYPANYSKSLPNVIAVAATNSNDQLASFSNYGQSSVDLAAPGDSILSTYPVASGDKYMYMSGTSLATPMVSGAVALLSAVHPNWSPAQIKQELLRMADVLPALSGKVKSGGRLNIAKIAQTQPPAMPEGVQITHYTSNSLTFTWNPDAATQSYKLEYSFNRIEWITKESAWAQTTYTHTGLPANATVYYRLTAINSWGTSTPAQFYATTLKNAPSAPSDFYVFNRRQTILVLVWTPVQFAETYKLEWSTNNNTWQILNAALASNSCTHSNLTADTTYYYRLTAVNNGGTSPPILLSARTLKNPPDTPENFQMSDHTPNSISLSWDTVTTAETYRLEFSRDQTLWQTLSDSLTETFFLHDQGLSWDTTYYYRLSAVNNGGASPAFLLQANTDTIEVVLPDIPENLQATIVDKKTVKLDWSVADGANQYRIERRASPSDDFQPLAAVTETQWVDHDLCPNVLYEYRVYSLVEEMGWESPGFAEISVIIEIVFPIARIDNADSLSVQEYCGMWVSAQESSDPLGLGLTYLWDFTGTGEFVEYAENSAWFSAVGLDGKPGTVQQIRLKVRDADDNESDIVEANVVIENVLATVFGNEPAPEQLLTGVLNRWEFTAIDIPEDYIREWTVDWGDGETTTQSGWILNRVRFMHTYWQSGTFTITVTAIDKDDLSLTFALYATVVSEETKIDDSGRSSQTTTIPEELPNPLFVLTDDMNVFAWEHFPVFRQDEQQRETLFFEQMGRNGFESCLLSQNGKPVEDLLANEINELAEFRLKPFLRDRNRLTKHFGSSTYCSLSGDTHPFPPPF